MSRLKRISGLVLGLSACGGVVYGVKPDSIYATREKSLFTLFTPTVRALEGPEPTTKWDYNWDRRSPEKLVKANETDEEKIDKKRSKANRHLFFIRHGQYNLKGKEDKDRVLTELGREQAHLTGRRLQEMNIPWTKLIRSTMTRATETSSILAQYLPAATLEACSLIEEGAPIQPQPPVNHWKPEKHQYFEDGARIEAGFRKHVHRSDPGQEQDSYEVIACHANVIRYFVCRALQVPPEAWLRMSLHHGSITWIIVRPDGRVILRSLGDVGHMPVDKISLS